MKTCPECGTQYEDHVMTCLVDGVDLSGVPSAAPPSSTSQSGPHDADAVPVVVTQTSGPSPGVAGGVLALAGLAMVLAVGVVVLAVVLWAFSGPPTTPSQPDPAPAPEPVPAPAVPVPIEPEPEPAPEPEPTIRLTSAPEGAEVWEGETKLCVTPCDTPHPPHAPLPRSFVLKRDGFLDTPYEMSDPSTDHSVTLKSRPRPQPTQPKGPKVPTINIER